MKPKFGIVLGVLGATLLPLFEGGESGGKEAWAVNELSLPNQRVVPGQKAVWFPVHLSNDVPIAGFQLMASFDPDFLTAVDHSVEFTLLSTLTPEFLDVNLRDERVEVGCLFEFIPPIEHRLLYPGNKATALHLIFDVPESAPIGATTKLEVKNDLDLSLILNIFTSGSQSVSPRLTSPTITIVDPDTASAFFTRGDVDADGRHNLLDVILTLNYLFQNGPEPRCLAAADFNDEGRVGLGSVLALMNFLFLGGRNPAVPFPGEGLDPTTDLPCD